MDAAERDRVRALLGGYAFVRVSDDPRALLVSDAPRRMEPEAFAAACERLREAGYACRETERGLLLIDWGEKRWEAFASEPQPDACPALPESEALHPLYTLAQLLLRHPAPLAAQPFTMLRALICAAMKQGGLAQIASATLADCARRLRLHEALPAAASGLILRALLGDNTQTEAIS